MILWYKKLKTEGHKSTNYYTYIFTRTNHSIPNLVLSQRLSSSPALPVTQTGCLKSITVDIHHVQAKDADTSLAQSVMLTRVLATTPASHSPTSWLRAHDGTSRIASRGYQRWQGEGGKLMLQSSRGTVVYMSKRSFSTNHTRNPAAHSTCRLQTTLSTLMKQKQNLEFEICGSRYSISLFVLSWSSL